jgi:hypothetical protein
MISSAGSFSRAVSASRVSARLTSNPVRAASRLFRWMSVSAPSRLALTATTASGGGVLTLTANANVRPSGTEGGVSIRCR